MVLRFALVGRRSNVGLVPRKYFIVIESDGLIVCFLVSEEVGILGVGYFGVDGLEATFCVQGIQLYKLLIDANIRILLLREQGGSLELLPQLS